MRIAILLYIVLVVAGLIGWFMNLIALIASVGGEVTTLFILRCLGVVLPILGAVLGFIG